MLNGLNQKNEIKNMKEYDTERLQICKRCPIFKPSDETCNSNLWINPNTDEISDTAKPNYIRGCGCKVMIKMRNKNSHCIAGKW